LPEPITCHPPVPGSSVIECDDVLIGPDPAPEPADSHAPSAGARALVDSHTPPLALRAVTADPRDTSLGDVALECSAEILGSAIAGAGVGRLHPALAALGVAKASIDLATCIYDETMTSQKQSQVGQAVEMCERDGGTLVSADDPYLLCVGGEPEPIR
jgi:hypothetical protein